MQTTAGIDVLRTGDDKPNTRRVDVLFTTNRRANRFGAKRNTTKRRDGNARQRRRQTTARPSLLPRRVRGRHEARVLTSPTTNPTAHRSGGASFSYGLFLL